MVLGVEALTVNRNQVLINHRNCYQGTIVSSEIKCLKKSSLCIILDTFP